jgi:DNA-binding NarL/FixJ family response regulator
MLATDTIKVQLVYRDALLAAGLTATLCSQRDFGVLAEPVPWNPTSALLTQADVMVTDYEHGLSILAWARDTPRMRPVAVPPVLILTQRDTESEIRYALEQGARGYLLLGCGIDELVAGVRALRAGTRHIAGKAAQRLADSVTREALTGREQAVLRLVVEGIGNKAIANRLDIAIGTVKSHLKSIFQKLDAASRTEVATMAERRGLLTVAGVRTPQWVGAGGRIGDAAPSARGDPHGRAELRAGEQRAHATH